MKIEIDFDLLLEAISGLNTFGKSATEETVKKIEQAMQKEWELSEN